MSRRRALLVLAVAVAALSVAATLRDDRPAPRFGRRVAVGQPVVDERVLSATWYCAVGTALPDGAANLIVTVANPGRTAREGTIVWIPTGEGTAGPVERSFQVPASGSVSMRALDALQAPSVSAIVEVDGGGVAVEHVVTGPAGVGIAPCSDQASDTWFTAAGTTERDAAQLLVLFNPFPDDAVVDVELATEAGREAPPSLTGLPIPPGSTTTVNMTTAAGRHAVTATSVRARTGRLVVERLQSFDGSAGRTGVSLALAVPAPSATWWFPEGLVGPGLTQRWAIHNPGDREAEVSLEIVPVTGEPPEPVDLAVPARAQVVVDAAEVAGLAPGVAHNAVLRSLNGVEVVAERVVEARAPSNRRGWSAAPGSTRTARSWVFAHGEASGNFDEWLVVQNPGTRPVRFSVTALVGQRLAVEDLDDLVVPVAGRLAVRLGDHIERGALALLVEADGPVVVERDVFGVGRPVLSALVGIPVAGG